MIPTRVSSFRRWGSNQLSYPEVTYSFHVHDKLVFLSLVAVRSERAAAFESDIGGKVSDFNARSTQEPSELTATQLAQYLEREAV